MPAERLARAPKLKAIVNVEGNFLPNVDYAACLDRGMHVLNASPAFALPVAEAALGMAIDLARGIGAADRAMRAGTESYGLDCNADAFLLTGSPVGIVGYGDLGRTLHRLLAPFACPVKVHDPWLPELGDPPRRRGAGSARRPARGLTRDLRVRVGDDRQRGLPRPRAARADPPGERVPADEPRRTSSTSTR